MKPTCTDLAVFTALFAALLAFLQRNVVVVGERDPILYCGACIALVEEIDWQTGTTDRKKKLDIGGFQLDAKGNMKVKQVPLKQSEAHIIEIMEYVCRFMIFYTKYVDDKGWTHYIRTSSRDGNRISREHTENITDIKHTLQFACEFVLEHHDDKLMELYKAEEEEVTEKLCVDIAGLCTKENVTSHMWAYASAIMLGLTEVAAEKGDKYAQQKLEEMRNFKETADGTESDDVFGETEVEEISGDVDGDSENFETGSSTDKQKNVESHIEL